MTDYVGELYRVTCSASDFDSTNITDDDIASMLVTIRNSAKTVIVENQPMAYDPTAKDAKGNAGVWVYLWVTKTGATPVVNLPAGTYMAEVIMNDLDGHESVEYLRIRLQKRPV